jgi:RNA polymerase sigma-70 factor (ECF subfamily)
LLKTRPQYNLEGFSDNELLNRYREKQDLDLLGALYQRYMLLVYGVCLKYLKNRDDSQDAVMQIFETLIHDVPRFEIRNFKSWLYGVARNHCLMKLRKDIRERDKQHEIAGELFMESTTILHPLEEEDDEEIRERLKTCLEQLKEEQRRCIELFYYQQQCYREIAAELMYDELKVKSFIQNGKRNLKICLESNKVLKDVGN